MTLRSRRLATALVVLLLAGSTAACGDDTDSGGSGGSGGSGASADGPIAGLEVSGEVGQAPEIAVDGLDVSDEVESAVLTEGDGPTWDEGEFALAPITIVNGGNGEKAYSDYDSESVQPLQLEASTLNEELVAALDGRKQGSRVAVAGSVRTLVGEEGAPSAGLAPEDDVVFLVDVVSVAQPPEGRGSSPEGLPEVVTEDGSVTGVDFSDAPRNPPSSLEVVPVVEGDGPAVRKGDTVMLRYYGVLWGGKEPFDESFSAEAPVAFPVGTGNLIKGWDEGLVGVEQGSRVLMVVPPEQGYGAEGSPPTIPGDSTLVFVIDVLGMAS